MPADSQVVPWGERMGSLEARVQGPKGRSTVGAGRASEAARDEMARMSLSFVARSSGDHVDGHTKREGLLGGRAEARTEKSENLGRGRGVRRVRREERGQKNERGKRSKRGRSETVERPDARRAFRLIGESGDGYLVEAPATAWALTASWGTTPSCCMRPRASQLT